ncbi:archaetidylserine decarboxylase [Bordetella sp. FB-8]|uniref:archaetidylserine decarboxylase n=1 Tax=Bordetella sp. FB-8 TaxID=1159870 RepID=UPI00038211FC|nr:archaetidylserine decarboxylase [Bordetella sp. FB-8]
MSFSDSLFLACQHLAPHHLISRLAGRLASNRTPWVKNALIGHFVRQYDVNMGEAQIVEPLAYDSFNDFFTRALKPGARPLDAEPGAVLSPADGSISQAGRIVAGRIFQAKDHYFDLIDLLGGDAGRAAPFANGNFATIYLSPRDYHRVHMPVCGTLREMIYVPGKLYSVNPLTSRNVPGLFARNERLVCIFDTPEHGPMALVLVGAMIVGSMQTVWAGRIAPHQPDVIATRYDGEKAMQLAQGAEMGRFLLGSTVLALFGPDWVDWTDLAAPGGGVRMGQALGRARSY